MRRTQEENEDLVKKAHTLVLDGSKVADAIKRFGIASSVYRRAAKRLGLSIPEGAEMKRRNRQQTLEAVKKAHALVQSGSSIDEATRKVNLSGNVYRNWAKKLRLPPPGAATGSMRADMLPPRPGKGGKRTPREVDQNDVQSLAMHIAKIDRKLASVEDLPKERKALAKRLMDLLRRK